MPPRRKAGAETASRFAAANPADVATQARGRSPARLAHGREHSLGTVIVSSLFAVLLAGAVLLGGHAAIGPLVSSAMAARDARPVGAVVYTMPDGIFCRHMAFDNVTAEITESAIAPCGVDLSRDRYRAQRSFGWAPH